MVENWFETPYYKVLYQNRDEYEAQEFIENLLKNLQPIPNSRMLDIACGEGRFTKHLADHGYDVTGTDISQQRIATAKTFETDNLHFYVQDMRFPFFVNYFDYAFNFFTSFGYFSNRRDHKLAARAFADCLKENGYLIIDYLHCDYAVAQLVEKETVVRGTYVFSITRKLEGKQIKKNIDFTDEYGVKRHYSETVTAFTLSDFIELFRPYGLSLVGSFGDYNLNSFNPLSSPRLIMVYKKRYV
jgi:SAM-dependent methyltransferase